VPRTTFDGVGGRGTGEASPEIKMSAVVGVISPPIPPPATTPRRNIATGRASLLLDGHGGELRRMEVVMADGGEITGRQVNGMRMLERRRSNSTDCQHEDQH